MPTKVFPESFATDPIGSLLRPEDAARRLNVKTATLAQWRWKGRGPAFVKIGVSIRYRLSDLDTFIEDRLRSSTTDPGRVQS